MELWMTMLLKSPAANYRSSTANPDSSNFPLQARVVIAPAKGTAVEIRGKNGL